MWGGWKDDLKVMSTFCSSENQGSVPRTYVVFSDHLFPQPPDMHMGYMHT